MAKPHRLLTVACTCLLLVTPHTVAAPQTPVVVQTLPAQGATFPSPESNPPVQNATSTERGWSSTGSTSLDLFAIGAGFTLLAAVMYRAFTGGVEAVKQLLWNLFGSQTSSQGYTWLTNQFPALGS
ncbi:hypothetical protein [Corynebacterium sp. HS2168-gen11]|uniref:hypothetical protein n=1 Tax=Corynebacterium sp. HS2168-gen11 TaxID=2974027 RepID=UPI00216ABE14|nr:hypothetical protein [Corynebacterium sp. HS2168-gen11]MCS4536221.1 hypothetical protein [Corynebacterium sp. HS2168-gen11]